MSTRIQVIREFPDADKIRVIGDTDEDDENPWAVSILCANLMQVYNEACNGALGLTLEATPATLEDEQP
jgi:hypothetical protein